ncbi:hypothetical protein LZ31DRAFT_601165 [Colletotrichum somersetense]|nr:hypothetical protein LZ31DRAFT_601165 [Colletotrichum somersetense]
MANYSTAPTTAETWPLEPETSLHPAWPDYLAALRKLPTELLLRQEFDIIAANRTNALGPAAAASAACIVTSTTPRPYHSPVPSIAGTSLTDMALESGNL